MEEAVEEAEAVEDTTTRTDADGCNGSIADLAPDGFPGCI